MVASGLGGGDATEDVVLAELLVGLAVCLEDFGEHRAAGVGADDADGLLGRRPASFMQAIVGPAPTVSHR
jgi:hypothetical protein